MRKKGVELGDLVAGGKDLVEEPGDVGLDHAQHLVALSPLNAGKEEGDEKEDIGEVLSEPGGKEGEDDGDGGGEGEDGGDEDLMLDEI